MQARLQHQAQQLSASLHPLLIEASRVADAVQQGIHGRRRAGIGETFWQFRRYEQGDPVERIDWRQSARTDKVFVREREWEAAQTACLWADTSGSMRYASSPNVPAKAERAQILMLALADLLLRGGEKIIWLDRRHISVHGKSGLERIVDRIDDTHGDSAPPDLPLPRRAHVVLCSDFLMPPEQLHHLMRRYASLNLRGALLHVLDPTEENFGFQGRVEMQGCEGEDDMLLPNAEAIAAAYREKLAAHKARVMNAAESAGWFYRSHVTSEAPHLPLLWLYEALARSPSGSRVA